jgi:hypothetical protein
VGDPVSVQFGQTLRGDREKIVTTLLDMSEMLQREVDARRSRGRRSLAPRRVSAEEITNVLAQQLDALILMLSTAPASFQKASSPKGRPATLRLAYAALLDGLISANESLADIQAPRIFAGTDAAFRSFVSSFYRQVVAWPSSVRDAAVHVRGDAFDIELSASVDIGPLVSAFAKETAAARV